MKETILANANLINSNTVSHGHVVVSGGLIKSVGNGVFPRGYEDMEGDYLMPGLVELHTDNMEKHLMPRQRVSWPEPAAALDAHDAQVAAAGITTGYDYICVGEADAKGRGVMYNPAGRALGEAARIRAVHLGK